MSVESRDETEASSLAADIIPDQSRDENINFFEDFDENSLAEVVFTEEKTEFIEKTIKSTTRSRHRSDSESEQPGRKRAKPTETEPQQGISSNLTKIEKQRISEETAPESSDPKKTQNRKQIKLTHPKQKKKYERGDSTFSLVFGRQLHICNIETGKSLKRLKTKLKTKKERK